MPETASDLRKCLSTSSSVRRRFSSLCVPSAPHGVGASGRAPGFHTDERGTLNVVRHRAVVHDAERNCDRLRSTALKGAERALDLRRCILGSARVSASSCGCLRAKAYLIRALYSFPTRMTVRPASVKAVAKGQTPSNEGSAATRLDAELAKLRTFQPTLTRSDALTYFLKFFPTATTAEINQAIDAAALPSEAVAKSSKPRRPANGPVRAKPAKSHSLAKSERTPATSRLAGGVECAVCGKKVALTPNGKVQRHRANGQSAHACIGGGRTAAGGVRPSKAKERPIAIDPAVAARAEQFRDRTGVPAGELAATDYEWLNSKGWQIRLTDAMPTDVVTARRILMAATNGHVAPGIAELVRGWYQHMKSRPELFDPKKKPTKWWGAAEGDPEKRLRRPRTPGKKVFYREVLVGKRN